MRTRDGISMALVVALVVVMIVVIAAIVLFAWAPWTGSSTQSTTSVLSTPANLLAITGQLPSASCGQPSGTYSNSSLAIDWGNIAPSTEGIQYLCIRNTGTTSVTLTVTSSLPSSVGKVTSPQAGTLLNGKGIEMIELDLWLSSGVPTGPISPFTITIGGKS